MNVFYKTIGVATDILRPILLKIFPYEWLRKVKRRMILHSYKKIEKIERKPFDRERYGDGINLVGDIKAESGLGQSCRLLANILEKVSYDMDIYYYNTLGMKNKEKVTKWDKFITLNIKYNINIIHINPHELGVAYLQMNKGIWDNRYNIAYWLWELEEFPDEWVPCFQCVDEIWAPSEFICNALRKKTKLPVHCIPYYIQININEEYNREYFGLPEEKFLYLMMYDSNSCMERKNPLGVIKAFKRAFDKENQDVGLVIKINNCKDTDLSVIHKELYGYNNIYLIRGTLSSDQVYSLIKKVDVVVSIHRAEGFGLVLAESMLLGTPCIATNWSSNIEFMNSNVACMVDYDLVSIEKDLPPFKSGNRWADPNIHQTADYMKKLFEDKKYYQDISEKAKLYADKKFSEEEVSKKIESRIHKILQKGCNNEKNSNC